MNKEKVKKFAKEHVKEIAGVTISAIAVGVIGSAIFKNGYRAGFVDGNMSGFHVTMDWFEKHFPEKDLKLNELWETYKLNNPDQIVYRTGLGKYERK